jgi:hypothetical protein
MKKLLAVLGSKRRAQSSSLLPLPQTASESPLFPAPVRENPSPDHHTTSAPPPPPPPNQEKTRARNLTSGDVGGLYRVNIEQLPPELTLAILEAVTEVRSLDALVKASPACWRAVQGKREGMLKVLLRKELAGGIGVDALSVSTFRFGCVSFQLE